MNASHAMVQTSFLKGGPKQLMALAGLGAMIIPSFLMGIELANWAWAGVHPLTG